MRSPVPCTKSTRRPDRSGVGGVHPGVQRHHAAYLLGVARRAARPARRASARPDRRKGSEAFADLFQRPGDVVERRVRGVPAAVGVQQPEHRESSAPARAMRWATGIIRRTESWVGLTIGRPSRGRHRAGRGRHPRDGSGHGWRGGGAGGHGASVPAVRWGQPPSIGASSWQAPVRGRTQRPRGPARTVRDRSGDRLLPRRELLVRSRGRRPARVCAVMTPEFLAHQQQVGNDLVTPRPEWSFPGLHPGDRWCVVAARWLQAYQADAAAPVVLASTNERALEVIPLEVLRRHSVDVPSDPARWSDEAMTTEPTTGSIAGSTNPSPAARSSSSTSRRGSPTRRGAPGTTPPSRATCSGCWRPGRRPAFRSSTSGTTPARRTRR